LKKAPFKKMSFLNVEKLESFLSFGKNIKAIVKLVGINV